MWLIHRETDGKSRDRIPLPAPLHEALVRWYVGEGCRQGLDRTARIMVTRTCLGTFASGDSPMTIVVPARLLAAVRRHEFTADNAAERDRGDFDFEGTRVYFRIDYYDAALEYGSEDPANASITRRVLTIMVREDL